MNGPALEICLTGATGYVGRALLRACEGEGVRVRALVQSELQLLKAMNWDSLPEWIVAVPGRLPDVPVALSAEQKYVMVHFGVKQIDHDGSGFIDTNVTGTERLLDKTQNSCLGVIYGSTLSVLGQGRQTQVTEQLAMAPKTALAKSRAAAETICYDWGKTHQRYAYGLRPRFILGEEDQFVLPGLGKLVYEKRAVGSGEQAFSVITVEDYAQIVLQLVKHIFNEQKPEQTALNIGYKKPASFNDILGDIASASGMTYEVNQRIPAYSWVPKIMRLIPGLDLDKTATQLELVGFDHSGDVTALEKRIGGDIVNKPTAEVLKDVIGRWVRLNKESEL